MGTDIVEKQDNSPSEMIRLALTGGVDLDKARQLLELQKDWEANEARKAYHKAMAGFKENPPKIKKDRKVGYESKAGGKVGYMHASLSNVVDKITKELSKHGLSVSWKTQQNGKISVTCRITHVMGYSEETTLSADSDTSGSKNPIQAIGSTITYLERYTLLATLGLAVYDQDDDGQASPGIKPEVKMPQATEKKQVDTGKYDALEALAKSAFNGSRPKWINFLGSNYGCEHSKQLTDEQFEKCKNDLNGIIKNAKK